MNALELVQQVKSQIEASSQIEESETYVSQTMGNAKLGTIRVMIPVEGKVRVIEVTAKELVTYEGL